jgi:hypothetical protein
LVGVGVKITKVKKIHMQIVQRRHNMWTVWVGGGEVNDYYLSETQAKDIAQAWIDKGYDEVVVEEIK